MRAMREHRWWHSETPRTSVLIGVIWVVGAAFQRSWVGLLFGVLGVFSLCAGVAALRADPPGRGYRSRLFPFWPPDD